MAAQYSWRARREGATLRDRHVAEDGMRVPLRAAEAERIAGRKIRRGFILAWLGTVLMVVWVHGRAIGSFFTSPDDLVHLQQAAGLLPTLPTPLRWPSQVLYFRLMFAMWGPNPVPFHIVTFVLHLVNVCLVYELARTFGSSRRAAWLGATLFGCFPLFSTLLSSAVGINDELAFCLASVAVLWIGRPGKIASVGAIVSFTLAMLCKESVIFLPLLGLLRTPGPEGRSARARRFLPLLAISALFAVLFAALRSVGLAPDKVVYAGRLGPNVFHNLMTYTSWAVDLRNPLPDLIASYDSNAWRVGMAVTIGALLASISLGRFEPGIRAGILWWLVGLLPVLPLEFLTYRHYMYPALPGLSLVFASTLTAILDRIGSVVSNGRVVRLAIAGAVLLLALAYAARARQLVGLRSDLRVPGTDLALDPVSRRREAALHAMESLGQTLEPRTKKLVILTPAGTWRVFGARSGHEYTARGIVGKPYNLLEESLDRGRAVKLFYPWVDSVAFIDRWTQNYQDYDLFLPSVDGHLQEFGSGPLAQNEAAKWMMTRHWLVQARDHLEAAVRAYPRDAGVRLGYGLALHETGDDSAALAQLKEAIRLGPADSTGTAARAIAQTIQRAETKGRQ
jgi:hypothetical protein